MGIHCDNRTAHSRIRVRKMPVIRAGNKTIVEVETTVYRKDGTVKDYEIDRIEIPEGGNEK